MRIAKSAVVYFLLVFAAGFALGAIRVPFLVPRLGDRMAEVIEAPFMLAVIVWAARRIVRRRVPDASAPGLLAIGAIALVLLLSVEATVVLRVRDMTLESFYAGRDPIAGGLYAVLLALYAVMPLAVARLGNETSTSPTRD